ncbi:MAG TPA: glycosyltransferase family 39 protein [Anaerolineae bacterium]|nr:glycosyltransferase family 39 protein [Anaerolineae bacterium]
MLARGMDWLSRYRLIFVLVLGLLCAALLLNRHLVPAGDNATYMILGQSLVTGRGYRMISDPRLPEMSLYPPGYPLLLAVLLAVTGTTRDLLAAVVPVKVLSLVLYMGALVLMYGILRRRNGTLATMTTLLVAVNPHILHFGTEVGTEIPFLFLSLGCVWLFERYRQQPSTQALLWVAALLGLTFYVRSVTLVMAAAFVLYLCVQCRLRHGVLLLVIVGALVAPWFVRTSLLPATGTSVGLGRGYFALYFSSDPYGTMKASLSDWLTRLCQNLRIYALEIWPDVLFPHALSVGRFVGRAGLLALTVTISALVLAGFVLEARRKHASEWYVALFFASCVGYLWAQSRLIVPIIPFAIHYFLVGVDSALRKVLGSSRKRARECALAAACAVLMVSLLRVNVRNIQRNLNAGLDHSLAAYYADDLEWSNYLRAVNWIVQDSPQPTAVMCRKADLVYLVTGNQALEYPYSTEGSELAQLARDNRVAYVIEDAFTWTRTTSQYLRPALQAWLGAEPEALALVYETSAPRTSVWRVRQLTR